jgi:hypothetical protein
MTVIRLVATPIAIARQCMDQIQFGIRVVLALVTIVVIAMTLSAIVFTATGETMSYIPLSEFD